MKHARPESHFALQTLVRQVIGLAVLDKARSGFNKAKSHVGGYTFGMQFFYPVKQAGARTVIIFAAGNNLLNLPGSLADNKTASGRRLFSADQTSGAGKVMSAAGLE